MRAKASIVLFLLMTSSCTGVKSVQLRPPNSPPPGLIWGYGVEKVGRDPDRSRQTAYLKAIDDLLTRGPVLVSRTVQDNTSVFNADSFSRTMQSTFRLRASAVIQPGFMDTGSTDGFVWVLLGTNETEIERGWQRFIEWRTEKIAQAERVYKEAIGEGRVSLLTASLAMLEDAGAQDDPGLLYYEVRNALDMELRRAAELANLQKRIHEMTDSGQLVAAELSLDQALRLGLEPERYQQLKLEVLDRREEASALIAAGDDCFRNEQYKQALENYQAARRLDRDNPQLPAKLAMADRHHRTARAGSVRSTVNSVGSVAGRAIGAYFGYKQEQERRKRAEAEADAAIARKQAAEQKTMVEISAEPAAEPETKPDAAEPEGQPEQETASEGSSAGGPADESDNPTGTLKEKDQLIEMIQK
jgi:tetratricopeptide (TPR) repeat protein